MTLILSAMMQRIKLSVKYIANHIKDDPRTRKGRNEGGNYQQNKIFHTKDCKF